MVWLVCADVVCARVLGCLFTYWCGACEIACVKLYVVLCAVLCVWLGCLMCVLAVIYCDVLWSVCSVCDCLCVCV